ncbi:MAG: 30S ribosomal protein S20 [Patescibacteria group bacterium]
MPVTKTAKRALRSSRKKALVNFDIKKNLEIAIRDAKKSKSLEEIKKAISLSDRAVKKNVIHKNKSSRIKKSLTKLVNLKKPKLEKKTKK